MSLKRRAALSGLLGASASCIAKLALDPSSPLQTRARDACSRFVLSPSVHAHAIAQFFNLFLDGVDICAVAELFLRALCFLGMIGLNACMMACYLDGMQESGTVAGTALANAANFSVSAIYGIIFFQESIGATWLMGFSIILLGVWLLSAVCLKKKVSQD